MCARAGPKDRLDSTVVSQPAIYVASLAAVEQLRQAEGEVRPRGLRSVPEGFAPFEPHMFALVHPCVLNQPPRPSRHRDPPPPTPPSPRNLSCTHALPFLTGIVAPSAFSQSSVPSCFSQARLLCHPFIVSCPLVSSTTFNQPHPRLLRPSQRFVACRAAMGCDPTCQMWRLLLLQIAL